MIRQWKRNCALVGLMVLGLSFTSCMQAYVKSVGGDKEQTFSRIYLTDFNTAWQAVLETLKSAPLDVTNREGGYVQTKWIDNTSQRNFIDSFGPGVTYLKSQYRVRISVGRGFYNGNESVKITVEKQQMVQHDVLEGWKQVESDSHDENTFLYRTGRLIWMRMKLAKLEELRTESDLEDVDF